MKTFEGYTAFSYRRFSSAGQRHGDIDRQLRDAKQVAGELGAKLNSDLVIDDSAVSGWKGKNIDPNVGQLGAFIQLARQKKLPPKTLLIIEPLDRFSRAGISKALPIFMELLETGVSVYSMIEGQIYYPKDAKDTGKMITALVSFAAANDFSEKLSQRISKAKQKQMAEAMNGKLINLGAMKPCWLDWNGSTYQKNKFFPVMKFIFNEYLSGSSAYQIAADLQRKAIPCIRGDTWSSGSILNILRNETAKGFFRGKQYFGKGNAVVTEAQFTTIQGLLVARKKVKGVKSEHVNFLRNILVCKHCGGSVNLSSSTAHKKTYHYYRCIRSSRGSCVSRQARSYPLEFSVLSSLGHNPELLIADNSAKERQLITTLQNRETELTKQITKLISLSDDMDLAELKQKLNKLKSEREAVKSALETARGNIAVNGNPETAVEEIENIVGNKLNALKFFASIQSVLSDIEKRAKLARVIPQLISKVELDFNKMEQTTTLKTGHAVETICFHDLQTGITEGF